jgi:hypothetical protein
MARNRRLMVFRETKVVSRGEAFTVVVSSGGASVVDKDNATFEARTKLPCSPSRLTRAQLKDVTRRCMRQFWAFMKEMDKL